ncbi:MAG: 9-O-acetylesterase, partial [Calditrichaeota bacterium]|nr:9-O-acetylesterase [Calditrichota bacterium]
WFRKTVTISKLPENGDDWVLNLDTIDDFDITFVNGKKAGEHLKRNHPTRYIVPANWLHSGENTIAVRVLDVGSRGGIWGAADQLYLASPAIDTIPLAGDWRFEIALDNGESPAPKRPYLHKRPTVLFNAMVSPLTKFPVRGVIWYQGESNISQAFSYRELFRRCITDWREKWDEPTLPFYFVQIANFYQPDPQPFESKWAELREAQQMELDLPNTGMAVTIDIGNPDDIHPKNKQEVGRRLALIALNKNYQQSVPYSGPLYRGNSVENGAIFIEFDFADGLRANGDSLTGFAISGSDKNFKGAKAAIADNRVKVWHPAIAEPVAVRYGWASDPDCNLINNSNLPASPFRTDDWDGITKKQN